MPWANQMTYIASARLVKRSFAPNSASLVVQVSEILPYCWFRAPAATSCVNHCEVLFIYPLLFFKDASHRQSNTSAALKMPSSWLDRCEVEQMMRSVITSLGQRNACVHPCAYRAKLAFACKRVYMLGWTMNWTESFSIKYPHEKLLKDWSPNVPKNLKASKII